MPQKIKNGTLMIEEGTALPELFPLESEPYFAGWRVVNGYEGIGLDKQLRKSGWTFFYMSAPVRVTVLGFGKGRVLRKAFRKILEIAPTPKFNCFEINEVVSRCFLGFSWVHLSGHARAFNRVLRSMAPRAPGNPLWLDEEAIITKLNRLQRDLIDPEVLVLLVDSADETSASFARDFHAVRALVPKIVLLGNLPPHTP